MYTDAEFGPATTSYDSILVILTYYLVITRLQEVFTRLLSRNNGIGEITSKSQVKDLLIMRYDVVIMT